MNNTTVQLRSYDNAWYKPGGTLLTRSAWFFFGKPLVSSSWIPFSGFRVALLRLFGATIGSRVVIKPSVEVKYPWHLVIGDDCWIGEHVWIDNLTTVSLGSNVCLSQGAYLCTGNHDWSDINFGLMISPVHLADGAWAGARSVLTPGSSLGMGAIASAGAVITGAVPDFHIYSGNPATFCKTRKMRQASAAQTAIAHSSDTPQENVQNSEALGATR